MKFIIELSEKANAKLEKRAELSKRSRQREAEFILEELLKWIKKLKTGFELDFSLVQDSITVVESEENLADGIVCASPFIKIGNMMESIVQWQRS